MGRSNFYIRARFVVSTRENQHSMKAAAVEVYRIHKTGYTGAVGWLVEPHKDTDWILRALETYRLSRLQGIIEIAITAFCWPS